LLATSQTIIYPGKPRPRLVQRLVNGLEHAQRVYFSHTGYRGVREARVPTAWRSQRTNPQ
jgi:hypothetical protein